jgi:hypothetical protein
MLVRRADPLPVLSALHPKEEGYMDRMFLIVLCEMFMSLGPMFGQGMTLAGSGYSDPSVIRVAPGQITTLFVTGVKTLFGDRPGHATSLPLPTTLAGFTVTLNQGGRLGQSSSVPVPLLSVQQVSLCTSGNDGVTPDCVITAITVQIPFELVVANSSQLIVSDNGNVSKAFNIMPSTDNFHILNVCDAFLFLPTQTRRSACNAVVTHSDGTPVTAAAPAKAGEEIVIYALGLGQTSPAVKTGAATPTPAPVLDRQVYVQFDFRPNTAPSPPYFNPLILAPFVPVALFAGLTPGEVGLYQINVRIPTSLPALGSCNGSQPGFPYNMIASNLTIDLGGVNSFDGAAICVQPSL